MATIAGGDIRIGGIFEYPPQTARGKENGASLDGNGRLRCAIERQHPYDFAIVKQQVRHGGKTLKGYVFERSGFAPKRAGNLAAGGIAVRVQNAIAAVRAFASKQEPCSFAIKCGSPFDELLDGGGRFFDQGAHGFGVA